MCLAHLLDLQPTAAVIDAERAAELAPNLALAQTALGWARIFAGRFTEAIEPIETAMRLSPRDPIIYFFNNRLGLAHYHLGNYDDAVRFTQTGNVGQTTLLRHAGPARQPCTTSSPGRGQCLLAEGSGHATAAAGTVLAAYLSPMLTPPTAPRWKKV